MEVPAQKSPGVLAIVNPQHNFAFVMNGISVPKLGGRSLVFWPGSFSFDDGVAGQAPVGKMESRKPP